MQSEPVGELFIECYEFYSSSLISELWNSDCQIIPTSAKRAKNCWLPTIPHHILPVEKACFKNQITALEKQLQVEKNNPRTIECLVEKLLLLLKIL